MGWSWLRGHLRRVELSLSISWRCGKDSWSVSRTQQVLEARPHWLALLPTWSWLDSWKGNLNFVQMHLKTVLFQPFGMNSFVLQLFSRLWPYQFWLLVCICFPAYASLPVFGMDMDCFSLWRIKCTVIGFCSSYSCFVLWCWTGIELFTITTRFLLIYTQLTVMKHKWVTLWAKLKEQATNRRPWIQLWCK